MGRALVACGLVAAGWCWSAGPTPVPLAVTLRRAISTAPAIELLVPRKSGCDPEMVAAALGALEAQQALKTAWDDGEVRATEVGHLGPAQVAVVNVGPGGSGRFWTTTVAVQVGRERLVGCRGSTTVAWRSLVVAGADPLPAWHPLGRPGVLTVWDSVATREGPVDQLLLPLAYVLDGRRLLVDGRQTKLLVSEWGAVYGQLAGVRGNGAAGLHAAAAAAYAELARP